MSRSAKQEGGVPDTINSEILALTYGAIVRQLLADLNDVDSVNAQLKQMGYNIGTRLIEEFLAKTALQKCGNFSETAKTIAERAFPMFLGVRGVAKPVGNGDQECLLSLRDIPLTEFVEIPPQYKGLKYCNLVVGVIEGALDRVNMKVSCDIVKDMLAGAQEYEISMKLTQAIPAEQYPFGEND